jgi:hypothetical protein
MAKARSLRSALREGPDMAFLAERTRAHAPWQIAKQPDEPAIDEHRERQQSLRERASPPALPLVGVIAAAFWAVRW